MKTATIYIAFDGERFDSAEDCKAHEAAHVETRLVGLTLEQVRAALSREDIELADAIEELGMRINRARREAGDLRRGKRSAAEGGSHSSEASEGEVVSAAKLDQALKRARAAGLAAWVSRSEGVVPESFSVAPPIADAWLAGWTEGKTGGVPQAVAEA